MQTSTADSQGTKIESVVPVKEMKLIYVKIRKLLNWILMWNFTLKGMVGAFQRGYCWYYNYVNVKKGRVLAAYVLSNYCVVFFFFYKELKHE